MIVSSSMLVVVSAIYLAVSLALPERATAVLWAYAASAIVLIALHLVEVRRDDWDR